MIFTDSSFCWFVPESAYPVDGVLTTLSIFNKIAAMQNIVKRSLFQRQLNFLFLYQSKKLFVVEILLMKYDKNIKAILRYYALMLISHCAAICERTNKIIFLNIFDKNLRYLFSRCAQLSASKCLFFILGVLVVWLINCHRYTPV